MKNVVLTFDDACRSHLEFVVPILEQYGFGATFFICHPGKWYQEITDAHLQPSECVEFFKHGFEIGNHTMNHPSLPELSEEDCRNEIVVLNDLFQKNGVPTPVSFAYPGGPYAVNAAAFLPEYGIRFARTTEEALWTGETDLMRIPSFSICDTREAKFAQGLELLGDRDDAALVLLYHGVPDLAHRHVTTGEELFKAHMKYLADNDFNVLSMADYGQRIAE